MARSIKVDENDQDIHKDEANNLKRREYTDLSFHKAYLEQKGIQWGVPHQLWAQL